MSVSLADHAELVPVASAVGARRRRQIPAPLRGSNVLATVSTVLVAIVVFGSLFPWIVSPGDPLEMHTDRVLQGPGETLLGTDQYGRSVLALIVHGTRVSVFIGLAAAVLGCAAGSLIGLTAGYFGGWVDMIISRVIDVLMCFPGVLLALVIAAALGQSTTNLILSVAAATLPVFARVSRSQVMSLRGRLFVTAARATGIPARRILFRHVLPNSLAPIIVLATVSVGTSIVIAASLSFLGLGPQNELPDWGQLLSAGQPYLSGAWWISTFPGITITITVIAVSLLGDRLRDSLDRR